MSCISKIGFGYVLVTNGVVVNSLQTVYGINPRQWKELPCEGVALLKIRQAAPALGLLLPVAVAVPTASTVTTIGDGCCSVANLPFVDPVNNHFLGYQIANNTEHLVYFNKCKGLFRILDCCRVVIPGAPVSVNTEEEVSVPVEGVVVPEAKAKLAK